MTPSTSDALQRGFTPTYISHSQRSPIDPIYQAQTNPLTYQAQQSSPARQKPDFGSFAFARLPYLDSRVSRCYGCGELLKPGGVLPPPPNDLVMTTRLHRKYYKDGQLQISPTISSVYLMSTRVVHEQPNQTSHWHRATYPTIWFHFFKRNTTI